MSSAKQRIWSDEMEDERNPVPVTGDDWFSQVVSFLVKQGMLDAREEYDISDVMAALADNYEPEPQAAGRNK